MIIIIIIIIMIRRRRTSSARHAIRMPVFWASSHRPTWFGSDCAVGDNNLYQTRSPTSQCCPNTPLSLPGTQAWKWVDDDSFYNFDTHTYYTIARTSSAAKPLHKVGRCANSSLCAHGLLGNDTFRTTQYASIFSLEVVSVKVKVKVKIV